MEEQEWGAARLDFSILRRKWHFRPLSWVLRQFIPQPRPALERTGMGKCLSDGRHHPGTAYLPVFFADVIKLLA